MATAAWSCSRCTFENEPLVRQCAMCMNVRPAATPAKAPTASPAPASRSAKKAKGKTTPAAKSPSTSSSLLFGVGSSAEKEQQRVQKKLQQLKELSIELPDADLMALLQRNCFSVPVAASAYFERLAQQDSASGGQHDDEAKRRLEQVLQRLETVDHLQSFQVLGKTTMQASVNRQGVQLQVGEELLLQAENAGKKRLRPGMSANSSASGGIVRIATLQHAQIGRLERNLEMLLHPLMKSELVTLGGVCETAPVSTHMFASFDVTVFVYVSVKAFDVFKEGDANFHLSDQLYNLLQMINGAEAPSLDALASRSTAEAEDPSSQVNPEDLDTLFSECVGANDLHNSADGSDTDPSEHLVQYLNAIELRDHQKQALRWMLWRENQLKNGTSEQESNDPMWEERHFRSKTSYFVNPFEKSASLTRPAPPAPCLGGILADDMGMGKTMMMLSLIAYQKHAGEEKAADNNSASSSRDKRKTTGKTLVVCPLSLLHQWKNEAQERFLPDTLSVHVYYGDDRDNGTGISAASFRKSDLVLTTYGVLSAEFEKNGVLTTTEWNRLILDEAHSIKNRSTGYFKTCSAMKATHRWCLTGTPIQNTLDDMFALLCFLQYQPWSRVAWWKRVITKPYEDGDDVNALGRLKVLLTPILLRRTKHSRDKQGKMIVQLPPKHVDLVRLEFSPDERAFYQAVYDKSRAEFNGFVASGSAMTSYVAIFALLLRLRQACDHPLLALGKDFEQALKPDDKSAGAATATSARSAFQPQQNESSEAYYQRIAAQLQKDMQASNRTQLLDSTDNESSSAGGLTASYIQSVIAQVEDGLESQECPICLDPPQNAVLTPCAHVLCDQCLRDSLANDPENGCPVCRTVVDMAKVFKLPPPAASKAQEDDCKTTDSVPDDKRTVVADDDGSGFESAKLQQLLRDLKAIKLENESAESPEQRRKVVVFSQWTSMLEMVSQLLQRHGFSHCTFNGALSQEQRERVLTKFAKDPSVEVLVISLKAGGVGLNLTCASVVVLLDPWWNPGVEDQAVDRVHRLGQTQDVIVKRYVVQDTVEDMILQLQQRKEKLVKHVLVVAKAHDERRSERLNLDDLRSFFR
ncbi:DNA repair protein [Phytophthora fragariae]|uniref:RanBP-type and C3HC4-type zinc finger-containing protein 1 n=1 Tax=Phytophthora fragariae TaxID=53985 RepID=A0A6A3Z681_9STRA|nr:DNA repair protein [Phytophthora fragariae]KAE9121709.1 DNA repair protein [Phytophthora fragariae]KAE9132010.1 DNA repair protein [Phytophthora fragariae]KAE9147114.1 DNA repair protein [Phytophthora fragariae]KAE9230918.1 DNA repair protein [Phytophthora fragariae]